MVQRTGKKSVLITGCSAGGIGDALAQAFHRAGCRVFATARNLSKIEHLKEMGMEVVVLDVVDPVSIKTAVDEVKAATGGTLDIPVNNSGISKPCKVEGDCLWASVNLANHII
jgi:1-acylglycerone phosphate reductase